jgi:hypothetical protein
MRTPTLDSIAVMHRMVDDYVDLARVASPEKLTEMAEAHARLSERYLERDDDPFAAYLHATIARLYLAHIVAEASAAIEVEFGINPLELPEWPKDAA